MNSRIKCVIGSLALLALAACTPKTSTQPAEADSQSASAVDVSTMIEMPRVPDSIRDPQQRADYIALRFWSPLDFASDAHALDTAFMEQSFANYAGILAYCSDDSVRAVSVSTMLRAASASTEALNLTLHIIDRYLDDPNSPMRNEHLYSIFLNEIARDATFEEWRRTLASEKLAMAAKNAEGSQAADLRFITRDGLTTTLRQSLDTDRNTLVMFYDSDCSHCSEITGRLAASPASRQVAIVAIDVAGDRALWNDKAPTMPAEWTVGFDLDHIEDHETYIFKALPTFYLLTPTATVLLKDPPLSAIIP